MVTAIVNEANSPTRGSTPARIEKEIAPAVSPGHQDSTCTQESIDALKVALAIAGRRPSPASRYWRQVSGEIAPVGADRRSPLGTLLAMSGDSFQIGEVARRVDLSINTIRHWHETGLAPPSGRSPGGFRLYTQDDVARIAFIKRFRPLGFGIEDIRRVLEARDALAIASGRERQRLVAQLEEYIAVANDRCAALRADLLDAEAFVEELEHDVARSYRPART